MPGRQSALGECPADQQAAVAIKRFAFGAEKADTMATRFIDHAVEPGAKLGPLGHGS